MGKDKVEKKDRAEKKEKRAEKDGVHKVKKEKKEKKEKTVLADAVAKEVGDDVMEGLEETGAVAVKGEIEVEAVDRPVGAVVPFANPLVEDKQAKKVLKSVKKGMFSNSVPVALHGLVYLGAIQVFQPISLCATFFFLILVYPR